jgi:hypothetical protein
VNDVRQREVALDFAEVGVGAEHVQEKLLPAISGAEWLVPIDEVANLLRAALTAAEESVGAVRLTRSNCPAASALIRASAGQPRVQTAPGVSASSDELDRSRRLRSGRILSRMSVEVNRQRIAVRGLGGLRTSACGMAQSPLAASRSPTLTAAERSLTAASAKNVWAKSRSPRIKQVWANSARR